MHKFLDETPITVKAGNGGAGCISFRHEKYAEWGGPDGGDGGKGGCVYFKAEANVVNLDHLRKEHLYKAENGQPGSGRNRTGRAGEDIVIKVPLGTQLHLNSQVIHDFLDFEPYMAQQGGRGGKGNAFFKTATRQLPRFAQQGEATEEVEYFLSLKLIADVGLVGFPNAGKSTLLKALTAANPKIANYPFTTLTPNLGVIETENFEKIVIADIPGILEGASRGHGLGLSFLKHIERVRLLVFVLDLQRTDIENELQILRQELKQYNEKLLSRPFLIALNKSDQIEDKEFLEEYLASFSEPKENIVVISAQTGDGIGDFLIKLQQRIAKAE